MHLLIRLMKSKCYSFLNFTVSNWEAFKLLLSYVSRFLMKFQYTCTHIGCFQARRKYFSPCILKNVFSLCIQTARFSKLLQIRSGITQESFTLHFKRVFTKYLFKLTPMMQRCVYLIVRKQFL